MRGAPAGCVAACVAALWAAAAPFPVAAAGGSSDLVLVRRECRTEIGSEDLTVYANGTVRLRRSALASRPAEGPTDGPGGGSGDGSAEESTPARGAAAGERWMGLGELTPDELEVFLRQLLAEDLAEAGVDASGPEGDWVESCVLELPVLEPGSSAAAALPPGVPAARRNLARPTTLRYRRFDSLALPLARVGALLDGVAQRAEPLRSLSGDGIALPSGYRPREGDVLRRLDGVLFRVVRPTVQIEEGGPSGWELQGVQQPLALYVDERDLPREFVELVSRRP